MGELKSGPGAAVVPKWAESPTAYPLSRLNKPAASRPVSALGMRLILTPRSTEESPRIARARFVNGSIAGNIYLVTSDEIGA